MGGWDPIEEVTGAAFVRSGGVAHCRSHYVLRAENGIILCQRPAKGEPLPPRVPHNVIKYVFNSKLEEMWPLHHRRGFLEYWEDRIGDGGTG